MPLTTLLHAPWFVAGCYAIAALLLAYAIGRALERQSCELCHRTGCGPLTARRVDAAGAIGGELMQVCPECREAIDAAQTLRAQRELRARLFHTASGQAARAGAELRRRIRPPAELNDSDRRAHA